MKTKTAKRFPPLSRPPRDAMPSAAEAPMSPIENLTQTATGGFWTDHFPGAAWGAGVEGATLSEPPSRIPDQSARRDAERDLAAELRVSSVRGQSGQRRETPGNPAPRGQGRGAPAPPLSSTPPAAMRKAERLIDAAPSLGNAAVIGGCLGNERWSTTFGHAGKTRVLGPSVSGSRRIGNHNRAASCRSLQAASARYA